MGKSGKSFGWITSLFVLLICNLSLNAKIIVPDFAFPQVVIEKGEKALKSDLKAGNDLEAFRNLLDICVAQILLSQPNASQRNIELVDSVSNHLDEEFRNLGFLLEAQLMQQNPDKDYNNILVNLERATQNLNFYRDQSLDRFDGLLTKPKANLGFNFSVSDFLAMKSVEILDAISTDNPEEIIPFFPDQINQDNSAAKISNLKKGLLTWLKNQGSDYAKIWAICETSKEFEGQQRNDYLLNEVNNFPDSQAFGLLIYECWRLAIQPDEKDKITLYKKMKQWLVNNPGAPASNQLKQAIATIEEKKIEIEIPNLSLPQQDISATATLNNLNKGYILIYKLKTEEYDWNDQLILKKFSGQRSPDKRIEIDGSGEIPFSHKKEITIPSLNCGLYVAIPSESPFLKKGWNKTSANANYITFRVSDISLLTLSGTEGEEGNLFVVDARNQKPIEGATVEIRSTESVTRRKNGVGISRFTTGEDGSVPLPKGFYRIEAKKGNSVAKIEAGFSYYRSPQSKINHANILTDLGVYRPGDTVSFAVVGWQEENYKKELLSDTLVKVIMRDVNFKEIGSTQLMLDKFGRAEGQFVIPEGRLLGNYRLMAEYPFKPGENAGNVEFEVSDYIMPGFRVEFQQKENGPDDCLVFEGQALTYSGLPIQNAPVDIMVKYIPWFGWRMSRTNGFYSATVVTNDSGSFKIELPTKNLKGTKFEKGRYEIRAEVLNDMGERQNSDPIFFFLGKNYEIRPQISSETRVEGDSLVLNIPVYSITGQQEKCKVVYKITGPVELSGEFESPLLKLPATSIPSGKYELSFKTEAGEEDFKTETIIYRPSEETVPYPAPLWIPDKEIFYKEGDKGVDVSLGSYYQGSYLLVVQSAQFNGKAKYNWIETSGKIQKLHIEIPDAGGEIYLTVAGSHNFELKTERIIIKPEKEFLSIETESFREKTESGDVQTWQFKFRTNKGIAKGIPVFAVMTDAALNAISNFKWNLRFNGRQPYCSTQLGGLREYNKYGYKIFNPVEYNYFNGLAVPDWETYGYSLLGYQIVNGPILMKSMATSRSVGVVETAAEMNAMDDLSMAEESNQEDTTSTENENEFRPVEMPLAFFLPGLETDENGIVNLKFRMPDFNTTWQFQIAGYTENLLCSSKTLETVATKPVMVKSNVPKYLRTGDKAEINASIFNNSDSQRDLTGFIAIYNNTGNEKELLLRKDFGVETVLAKESSLISVLFDVPYDVSDLRVEIFGESEGCKDGEATNIRILPSSSPVIESQTFYLNSAESELELELPKFNKDDELVFTYVDNPLWDALLTLSAFDEVGNGSVLSVANRLYVNLMTKKMIDSNPNMRKGLTTLLEKELADGNLNSEQQIRLAQNEATPWINSAAEEKARIESLKLYLNSDKAQSLANKFKSAILNSQLHDGGWSWFEGMNSSVYITERVISVLGILQRNGLLSKELKDAAIRGINYVDKALTEQRKKDKGFNVTELTGYLLSRNNFDVNLSPALKRIEKECLDSVTKNWRKWGIVEKCNGALLLWSEPSYKKEAETIVASIKDFVIRDSNSGWNFGLQNRGFRQYAELTAEGKALETIEIIQPDSAYLEGLRQWLLLQKETQDWGLNPNNIDVVNVLVSTSSENTFETKTPEILIGQQILDLPEAGRITGNFSMTMDPSSLSGKNLEIKRATGQPAWGAVISRHIRPVKEVKEQKTDILSIQKEIAKRDSNGRLSKVSKINKGDKVTVVLYLELKKDMDFVAVTDERGACLRPMQWLSGMVSENGIRTYKESRESKTSFFIDHLKAGKYTLTYECVADREGDYTIGIASIQSLYAPQQVAHTKGMVLKVEN